MSKVCRKDNSTNFSPYSFYPNVQPSIILARDRYFVIRNVGGLKTLKANAIYFMNVSRCSVANVKDMICKL